MAKTSKKKTAPTVGSQERRPMGRPTDYGPHIIEITREYLDACIPFYEDKETKLKVVKIPTIEGLAVALNVRRETIHAWDREEDKLEFSHILGELRARQAEALISHGLSGDYNPTIAKVLLTKHGYREGLEQSGEGGGPVRHTVDITDQLNKTYGDDSASEVSGDSA